MSIRITLDIFSGRNNPCWEVRDLDQERETVEDFARHQSALGDIGSGFTGLGFRGIKVDFTSDVKIAGLPSSFELAGGGAQDPFASAGLADRVLDTAPHGSHDTDVTDAETKEYWLAMRATAREEISRATRRGFTETQTFEPLYRQEDDGLAAEAEKQLRELNQRSATCAWDAAPFQPDFWNQSSVQPYNNCYNYAVNIRTDTRAKPGRYHGFQISPWVTGSEVAAGVFKDGLNVWGTCQPEGNNRVIVAMVTGAFSTGVRDFHFYRLDIGGHWSHKMAENMARRTDNSGIPITNPYLCDRGIYTEWNGFFQSHNSVRIK
ncbi:hypothetical protein [Streptomyces sp. NPDC093094]|uniref:hypothetical protein n=1 Tax=Streptomyces sp. NPDC093094 TaxID=3366026 RepID=UPI003802CC60